MGKFKCGEFYTHENRLVVVHILDIIETEKHDYQYARWEEDKWVDIEIDKNIYLCEMFAVNGRYELHTIDNTQFEKFTEFKSYDSLLNLIPKKVEENTVIVDNMFEEGKYYKHSTGYVLHTLITVDTCAYGRCLIAQEKMGELIPIQNIEDKYNWTEITKEEYDESEVWLY